MNEKKCRKCGAEVQSEYPRPLCSKCFNSKKISDRQKRGVIETRAGEYDIWKKRPQPCAYDCGRTVYTIYPVAICNICRKKKGMLIHNE